MSKKGIEVVLAKDEDGGLHVEFGANGEVHCGGPIRIDGGRPRSALLHKMSRPRRLVRWFRRKVLRSRP